jgi:uncharacterized protein (TIGR03792 family)
VDRDNQQQDRQPLRPLGDSLDVLIDLNLNEGPDDQGDGWQVAIVEHLRLQVPADARQAWIEAELQTWDPWLRQQQGFLGREVLWDKDRQEGVLLIHWANRQDWKSIPTADVATIQESFESAAKQILTLPPHSDNPFPLVYSGEIPVS